MTLEEIVDRLNQHKKELEDRFNVKSLAIFGSYVRNEATPQSDVDILVEFREPVGLLFVHLADYLEQLLGTRVDLLTPQAIKPNRKKSIMKDLIHV